jgi:ferredoxin-NADP reductase
MILHLAKRRHEAGDAYSFFFRPEIPISWEAGQFMHYSLEHQDPDERRSDRYFSISSAPYEGHVRLTTRISDAPSSFKRALNNLPIGGVIGAQWPEGGFTVDDPGSEIVMIAGGIGITPYRSMLLEMDHRGTPIEATLLYANKTDDAVFKDELESLTLIHPGFRIGYFIGENRLDVDAIARVAPDLARPVFYVSGPETMARSWVDKLRTMGVPQQNIKTDFFPGYEDRGI